MGFYVFFVKNQMEYGSKEVVDFINIYFLFLNYWILKVFNEIVCECYEIFVNFEKFKYVDGFYFDKYII